MVGTGATFLFFVFWLLFFLPQQHDVNLKTFAFPGCHEDISGSGGKKRVDLESIKLPLF